MDDKELSEVADSVNSGRAARNIAAAQTLMPPLWEELTLAEKELLDKIVPYFFTAPNGAMTVYHNPEQISLQIRNYTAKLREEVQHNIDRADAWYQKWKIADAKPHSRQLWLEAAPLEELQLLEDALFIAASRVAPEKRKMLMLDLGERVFQQKKARAKAESTPKPSPVLPREERNG